MGFVSLIVVLLGIVAIGIGLFLGVGNGQALGGMVGLVLGISLIAMGAFVLKGDVYSGPF
jgi:hypothetical protein